MIQNKRVRYAGCYSHGVINLQVHSVKVWEVYLQATKATTCSDSSCFFCFCLPFFLRFLPFHLCLLLPPGILCFFFFFLFVCFSLYWFPCFPFLYPFCRLSRFLLLPLLCSFSICLSVFFSFLLPCSLVQPEAKLLLGDEDDGEADSSKLLSSSVLPLFFLLSVVCFLCIFKSFSLPLFSLCSLHLSSRVLPLFSFLFSLSFSPHCFLFLLSPSSSLSRSFFCVSAPPLSFVLLSPSHGDGSSSGFYSPRKALWW